MTDEKMLARLDAAILKAGGVRAFARLHKLSPAYVSDVQRGQRGIGASVAKAIGYRVKLKRITTREYFKIPAHSLTPSEETPTNER